MLFDLQSPRRRRLVKVVYGTLAVLFGVGFLFFFIGSDVGGGQSVFESLGIGGSSNSDPFEQDIQDAEDAVKQNPRNERALATLVVLQVQKAGTQVDSDGVPTSDGVDTYQRAADAWDQYLKLKPKQPDQSAALQMVNAFYTLALTSSSAADARTELGNAADAQQVVVDQRPTVSNLRNLAYFLYLAGRFGEADRVKRQALAEGAGKSLEKQLEQARSGGEQLIKQERKDAKSSAQTGSNPLSQPGGAGLGGGTLTTP